MENRNRRRAPVGCLRDSPRILPLPLQPGGTGDQSIEGVGFPPPHSSLDASNEYGGGDGGRIETTVPRRGVALADVSIPIAPISRARKAFERHRFFPLNGI